jgi:hypothetical protein
MTTKCVEGQGCQFLGETGEVYLLDGAHLSEYSKADKHLIPIKGCIVSEKSLDCKHQDYVLSIMKRSGNLSKISTSGDKVQLTGRGSCKVRGENKY